MTALPSFCELMASLGLDAKPQTSGPGVTGSLHSRTPSTVSTASSKSIASSLRLSPEAGPAVPRSPSIIISHHDADSDADRGRRNSVSRPAGSRYAPYHVIDRRGSVPSFSSLSAEDEMPIRLRSSSSSPKLSPTAGHKVDRAARRRARLTVSVSEKDLSISMPISSLARRKSPQTSPVAPTFAAAGMRTPSPPAVAIPMLPALLPAPALNFTFPPREAGAPPATAPSRRKSASPGHGRRPTGVRLSIGARFDHHTAHHVSRDIAPVA